jgi:hypothetical protein
MSLVIDFEEFSNINLIVSLQKVTDFLKLVESVLRTVENYMIHNLYQMLIEILTIVLVSCVSQNVSQVIEVFDLS